MESLNQTTKTDHVVVMFSLPNFFSIVEKKMNRDFPTLPPAPRRQKVEFSSSEAADAIRAASLAAAQAAQSLARGLPPPPRGPSHEHCFSLRCPQSAVGRVIGKKGESISQMHAFFGCQVQVDQSTKDEGFSTVKIGADSMEALEKCKLHIEALISSTGAILTDPQESVTEMIDLPETSVGAVIGPKGVVIQNMITEFAVSMWVDQSVTPKRLGVSGTKDRCDKALKRVYEIISGKYNPMQSVIEQASSSAYFKYQTDILQAFKDTAESDAIIEKWILSVSIQNADKLLIKRGLLLKQIRASSCANINIDTSHQNERLVVITGPQFAAARALAQIRQRIPNSEINILQAPNIIASV